MGRCPLRGLAVVVALAIVVCAPSPANAQAVADLERRLLPMQAGPLVGLAPSFWEGLALLREEEDRQRSLLADITFGLSGDEAGERSLFKLNTGISLSRGVFPSELSVVSRLGLQLRDGRLQEDVTSLQITYDYHASRHVQYFTFAERFTDSFLSIQQRYEIGFGARVGASFGRIGSWRASDARFAAVNAGLADIEQARAASPSVAAALAPGDVARFRTAIGNLGQAIEDRQARLLVGVVASVFAELERAELEVTSFPAGGSPVDPNGAITSKVALDAEQRYRLNLRPTFRLRPNSQVVITVFPYFKLPLDGPRYVQVAGGDRRLDYRRDILSEMVWSIRSDQTGLESVDVVFTFNHHFDNVPPSLPATMIDDAEAAGRAFARATAEQRHRVLALSLKLRW
jgi:hypothetical protein